MAGLNDLMSGAEKPGGLAGGLEIGHSSNKELMGAARDALSGQWIKVLGATLLFNALWFAVIFFMQSIVVFTSIHAFPFEGEAKIGAVGVAGLLLGFFVSMLFLGAFAHLAWCSYFRRLVDEGESRLNALFSARGRLGAAVGSTAILFVLQFIVMLIGFFSASALAAINPFVALGVMIATHFVLLMIVLRFSMTFFILSDEEPMGGIEALRESWDIMGGKCWKLARLFVRFIPWALLANGPQILFELLEGFGVWSHPWATTSGLIFSVFGGWLLTPYVMTSLACFYEDAQYGANA